MSTYETLRKQFSFPENRYRPVQIIHHGFPKASDTMDAYIEEALKRGIGGFVVNAEGPWGGTDQTELYYTYLKNPDEWDRIKLFIDKCIHKGLRIWLYDEMGFPSGAACRWVYESNPEFQVMGVECQNIETSVSKGSMTLLEGIVYGAFAYPKLQSKKIDTSKAIPLSVSNNEVFWDLDHREYIITAFIARKVEWYTSCGVPYVDILRHDVVEKFIELTHDQYLTRLGKETFSKIESIFTDEPSIVTHGCSFVLNEQYPLIPWTHDFKDTFYHRYGYDITQNFVHIFFETDNEYKKIRRDFWKMVSGRLQSSYFKQIFDWCEKNDIQFTGHLYGEETLSMQTGLNGELFGLHRYMQMPGIDRLYCTEPKDIIPEKTASSAAHLLGYPCCMSESSSHFEECWWKTTYDLSDMINSCTYQYVLGINTIASYYDLLSRPQEETRLLQTYIGRLGAFISQGVHHAPLLVHIPMAGAWERYIPVNYKYWKVGPSHVSPYQCEDEKLLEQSFGDILLNLMNHQLDFDLIDDTGIQECKFVNHKITTGIESFDCLVIMDTGCLENETFHSLRTLLHNGAKIIFVTYQGDGKLSERFEALANICPENVSICSVPDVTAAAHAFCSKDLFFDTEEPYLWYRHNAIDNIHVYLLSNRENTDRQVHVNINLPGNVEIFYPLTGEIIHPPTLLEKEKTRFHVLLPQKSGILIVMKH